MPSECQTLELEDFSQPYDLIIYGIEGSSSKGFSHEVPIKREEARLLWSVLKPRGNTRGMDQIRSNPKLDFFYYLLTTSGRDMGFTYHNEGEVLEALALIDLENIYPDDKYFQTGGVAYSNGNGRIVGELDVLVGRKSDCKILVVGETKLGIGQIAHARSQLQRFESFLRSQNQ